MDQIIEDALAFPHQQPVEAFQAQVDACLAHDTADRLPQIVAPTLVMASEFDTIFPSRFGRLAAEGFEPPSSKCSRSRRTSPSRRSRTSGTRAFWRGIEGRD